MGGDVEDFWQCVSRLFICVGLLVTFLFNGDFRQKLNSISVALSGYMFIILHIPGLSHLGTNGYILSYKHMPTHTLSLHTH